ncbi:hypothetical protein [Actinophytocola sp.]|uniref:hypothetical protein n=1 Tax=Actinophytocola sp. TaxID=1872138 RepID=UPI002D7F15DE|nr:hypothetical protein [Actinophytocola sp.]HET9142706.1 hypothetical protein [Actinophytocola sp.]
MIATTSPMMAPTPVQPAMIATTRPIAATTKPMMVKTSAQVWPKIWSNASPIATRA